MIDPGELRKAIAANVRRLRIEKDLTQDQLAARAGVSYVQLNRLENGHNSPSAELLFSLADALGVPADMLRQVPLSV